MKNNPNLAVSTAISISASSIMIRGDLPPNSNEILFKLVIEQFYIINYPTSLDPVNAILSTLGWLTKAAPVSPNPVTILTTPGGNPASLKSSANLQAETGVYSAGFKIMVHPHARAGANFQIAINSGKFHGIIYPQTPAGSTLV